MEPLERAERSNDSQYLSELFQLEEYGDRGHTVKKDKEKVEPPEIRVTEEEKWGAMCVTEFENTCMPVKG